MLYGSPRWISDRNLLSALDCGAGNWKPASGTGMGFLSIDHHHWLRSCKLLDLPPHWWTSLIRSSWSWNVGDEQTRWEFAPEFKREAVALLESSGRPLTQVAGELGIQPSMLRAWRR
jgi:Transposase